MNAPVPSSLAAEQPSADGGTVVAGGERATRYRAFLSYSHADMKWANWLLKRLEGYRVPRRFHGRAAPIGAVGARIVPVFRDRDELPTASDLGETIRTALRESATLVVICSPAAAKSRWVREEIVAFKRLHGEARVFAFIVRGEPNRAGAEEDCFSPALRAALGPDGQLSAAPAEVVAADARPHADGKEDAFIRLVAGLLGVGFDDLRRREHARRLRRMMWITGGSVAGMALTLGLAAMAWHARNDAMVAQNDAQRRQERGEELLTFMLNDLKTGLEKADKLDALDEAGARMMAYFQSLNPRDLTDKTNVQQAKALTQIGRIRIAQLRYAEASAAFSGAFGRLSALTGRHPGDGNLLFERAQAEYWIGNVHYKHGDLGPAGDWFTRYRDSALALAALDPKNQAWLREVGSGHHNLAVVELERGNLPAAHDGFVHELVERKRIAAENPLDRQAEFSVSNIVSYLGTVAERNGDLAGARARFAEQTQLLGVLVDKDPLNARWQERVANALALEGVVHGITGRPDAARGRYAQARAVLEALVAKDAANRVWQMALWRVRLREAELRRVTGDMPGAHRLAAGALAALARLEQAESSDRAVAHVLANAWRLEARLHETGDLKEAAAAAAKALTVGEELVAKRRANDDVLGGLVLTCLVAADLAERRTDHAAAQRFWERGMELARPQLESSRNWTLLDPAARVLALLGRSAESRALVERLVRYGYQPIEPWPQPGLTDFSSVKTSR